MAQSLPNVVIKPNQHVDIYAATGITVGVQIIIQHVGGGDVELRESATQPDRAAVGFNLIRKGEDRTNSTGAIGAWAYAARSAVLHVEVV